MKNEDEEITVQVAVD